MTGAGRWGRVFASMVEYLTMRRPMRGAGSDAVRRAAALEALREARQKRDASELLLLRGSRAEALRLGAESLERLRRGLERIDASDAALMKRAIERVERCGARLGTPPQLDSAVTSAQAAALRALLRAEGALDGRLDVAILDRRGLLRLRRQRWVLAAAIVLAPVGLAAFVRGELRGLHIRASSVLDEEYAADRAIDGDPETEWVPAGSGEEWVELRFRARRVGTLSIQNGDLLPDRAARKVQVEFYLDGKSYGTTSREFDVDRPGQSIDLAAAGLLCDRIRIVVATHYGTGGALAEVRVN